jgi:hypothetical protein
MKLLLKLTELLKLAVNIYRRMRPLLSQAKKEIELELPEPQPAKKQKAKKSATN